jgi:hypothetical protein
MEERFIPLGAGKITYCGLSDGNQKGRPNENLHGEQRSLEQFLRASQYAFIPAHTVKKLPAAPEMGPMTYRITAFAAGAEFLLLFWFARSFAVDLTGQRSLPLVIQL